MTRSGKKTGRQEVREADIAWFWSPPTGSSPSPPPETRAQVLPFHDLTWEDFERLCFRLAHRQGDVEHIQLYGLRGQRQDGVDILVRHIDGQYSAWQCKRYQRFTAPLLREAVDDLLAGPWALEVRRFHLCVATPLSDTRLTDEIGSQAKRLGKIDFQPLGADQLSEILKKHPDLVDDFFGREWVRRFLGPEAAECLSARTAAESFTAAADDLSWLLSVFNPPKPFHILYGGFPDGVLPPSPDLAHYFVALLFKYSPLFPPVVDPSQKPYVEKAMDRLGLQQGRFSSLPSEPGSSTVTVVFGAPPLSGPKTTGTGFWIQPPEGVQPPASMTVVRTSIDRALFHLLARCAAETGRDEEMLSDLVRIPPPGKRVALLYQAFFSLEIQAGYSPAIPIPPPPSVPLAPLSLSLSEATLVRAEEAMSLDRLSDAEQLAGGIDFEELSPPQRARAALLRSQIALESGQINEAEVCLRRALGEGSEPLVVCNLAILLCWKDRIEEATKLLAEAELQTDSPPVRLAISLVEAWSTIARGQGSSKALPRVDAVLAELGDSLPELQAAAFHALSVLYLHSGQLGEAQRLVERAHDLDPLSLELQLHRAIVLLRQFPRVPLDAAEARPSGLVARIPLQLATSLEQIRLQASRGGRTALLPSIDHVLGVAYYCAALGTQLSTQRRTFFLHAAESFEIAQIRSPSVQLLSSAGEAWLQARQYESATACYSRIPDEERSPSSRCNHIAALLLSGQISPAITALQEMLAKELPPPPVLANLGLLLLTLRHYSEALTILKLAQPGVGSSGWKVDFLRGRAFFDLGRFDEAEEAFRSAIAGNAHNPRLYLAHLEAFTRSSAVRAASAVDELRTLLAPLQADVSFLEELGRFLDEAIGTYRKNVLRFQQIPAEPGNSLATVFLSHLERLDLLSRSTTILEDIVSSSGREPLQNMYIRAKEAIKGPQKEPSWDSIPKASDFLAQSSDWLGIHRRLADTLTHQNPEIRVDDVSATVLSALTEPAAEDPARQWLHLLGRRIAIDFRSERLLAYNHADNVTIKAYQEAVVRSAIFRSFGRVLLADEVGLGKTIEAGLILSEYRARGLVRSCLLLVPSPGLACQWADELSQKFRLSMESPAGVAIFGSPTWRSPEAHCVSIFTFQKALSENEMLRRFPWDMVIVDEAHHLRSRSSQGFKLVSSLRNRYLLLLTATPLQNKVDDVYSLAFLLRPSLFGTLANFRRAYTVPGNRRELRNSDDLVHQLSQVMIRNRTRGVAGEVSIGKRCFEDSSVTLGPRERAFYQGIEQLVFFRHDDCEKQILPLPYYTLARAACSSPRATRRSLQGLAENISDPRAVSELADLIAMTDHLLPEAKLNEVHGILSLLGQESAILFTEFRETAACVAKALDGLLIDNRLAARAQTDLLGDFLAGRSARVLVATPRFAEGLNLQDCHNLINFDLPWNPFRIEQRIGRIHRIGQRAEQVRIFTVSAAETIEDLIREVLVSKLKLFEQVVGRQTLEILRLEEGTSFENRLREILQRVRDRNHIQEEISNMLDEELRPFVQLDPSITQAVPPPSFPMLLLDRAWGQMIDKTP